MPLTRLHAVARFARTVIHLRWEQIVWRLWYRLYRPRPERSAVPGLRCRAGHWARPIAEPPTLVDDWTFRFLGEEGELRSAAGWNDPGRSRLWLYHLHYFDDLNSEGGEHRLSRHKALIERWIAENPPGEGPGWEPYPVSRRVVNWLKWDLDGNPLQQEWAQSLAVQVRWLRRRLEYHILGNHLLANAKALVFAGLYFEGPEAESWLRTGLRILERELPEQVLPDGGHFERSPMYHRIVLADLLDLVNVHRAYGREPPPGWQEGIRRMLAWGAIMRHPDDEVPLFNDAAFGMAPPWTEFPGYANRLGCDGREARRDPLTTVLLEDSGYARFDYDGASVFVDAGPIGPDYLPGHAHADTLSLELSLFGVRVLVNSGTSTYKEGQERARQRGTAAHNTLMIDGQDSSEVWRSFRVARRARVRGRAFDAVAGEMYAWHDGYCRLPGRPVHARRVYRQERALEVVDSVTGRGEHSVVGAWHLHPDVVVRDAVRRGDGSRLELTVTGPGTDVNMVIEGPVAVAVEPATWHPAFGWTRSNRCVRFSYEGVLPLRVITRVAW